MGKISERAADDAKANVGVQEEGGENRGKAVETYLRSVGLGAGYAWCAAFINYRLRHAARELEAAGSLPADMPSSGYVPDWENWARKTKRWVPVSVARAGGYTPAKGDLCLFYFAAKGRTAHIGIVEGTAGAGFLTVEGNTSPSVGVDRDGDGVFGKKRSFAALGARGGFIRCSF